MLGKGRGGRLQAVLSQPAGGTAHGTDAICHVNRYHADGDNGGRLLNRRRRCPIAYSWAHLLVHPPICLLICCIPHLREAALTDMGLTLRRWTLDSELLGQLQALHDVVLRGPRGGHYHCKGAGSLAQRCQVFHHIAPACVTFWNSCPCVVVVVSFGSSHPGNDTHVQAAACHRGRRKPGNPCTDCAAQDHAPLGKVSQRRTAWPAHPNIKHACRITCATQMKRCTATFFSHGSLKVIQASVARIIVCSASS